MKPYARKPPVEDARREPITVRPPFDPEAFARDAESAFPSTDGGPPPSARPTVPPPPGLPQYSIAVAPSLDGRAVPVLTVSREDLEWFDLGPLAHRLLAGVDGRDAIAAICERAAVPIGEAISVFEDLVRDGLIACR
jgi:hypothetical protein